MSDEKEKLNREEETAKAETYSDEYVSYETIFGDPAAHRDAAPKQKGKKRVLGLVAGFLAVAVLVGGILAVIRFIPKLQEEEETPAFENIEVLSRKTDGISAVTVKNTNGTVRFLPQRKETDNDSSDGSSSESTVNTAWTVEGIDAAKTDSSKITPVITAATTVTATRKIDSKSAAECGLDTPKYQIEVQDAQEGDYTLSIGDLSPDKSGVYLQVTSDEAIYLVDESSVTAFDFTVLDFADTTAIPALEVKEEQPDYVSDGKLIGFETMTVSGKNFPEPVVFEMNKNDEISSIFSFNIVSPVRRIAENTDDVFKLFSEGLTVGGAYAYDVSDAALKSVGLDNPTMVIDLTVGGHRRIYRIAKVDDEYSAVIIGDSVMIYKVSNSFLPFLDYTAEKFYSKYVYMRSIKELSNLTLTTAAGERYSFDIVYNEGDENAEFVITSDGKDIKAEYFQNFYQEFVGLNLSDFSTEPATGSPEATVTLTYKADGSQKNLTFTKVGETRYRVTDDGTVEGSITSSSYVKLLRYAKRVAENQNIN